jgi:hypothetical protein
MRPSYSVWTLRMILRAAGAAGAMEVAESCGDGGGVAFFVDELIPAITA